MLGMPAPTPFDLNFRLFRIPIQVSPWFWLVAAMLGANFGESIPLLLTFMACVFASILIHEMGHGLTDRYFGFRPRIALHWMGGLCQSDQVEPPRQRLVVLLMGPGAQFLLLGLVFLVGWLGFGVGWRGDLLLLNLLLPFRLGASSNLAAGMMELARMNSLASTAYFAMISINLLWALLNLLPIYPLDGGQILQIFLVGADRVHGARRTHIVSMITAGLAAAYVASRMTAENSSGLMMVVFFGSFALMNFQALQAHHDHYMAHGPDDADWWKR